MDETPRKRLARLIAGVPANSPPIPNFSAPLMTAARDYARDKPVTVDPQTAQDKWWASLPPYAGPRNEQALPPFKQPGGSLPMDRYTQPQAQPAPMPQAPAAPFAPPTVAQSGGQGWGGPEPAPGTMPGLQQTPNDSMMDPRYLPEQWKGAFNTRWQS